MSGASGTNCIEFVPIVLFELHELYRYELYTAVNEVAERITLGWVINRVFYPYSRVGNTVTFGVVGRTRTYA